MKCLNCNREIDKSLFPEDLTYCPYCGEEIGSASIGEKLQFCPYCGKKLTEQTSFCPHCGKKLSLTQRRPGGEQFVKDFIEEGAKIVEEKAKTVAKAIRNTFGREKKIRKLYQQWAEFSDLPPEEVPTMEELKKMSAEEKAGEDSPLDEEED
jgi:DNA-directed RNA polymerase subunit RPC12/RpoP